ncbi:MAG: GC-type dockerin domain-anchored protein [Phycisphaerales bacterium]
MPGYTRSAAYLVSGNGSVVVGRVPNSVFLHEALVWIWTPTTGMRDLKQVLLDMGVVLATTVVFFEAAAISDSGEVLCGIGYVGAAFTSWVADISPGCYTDCTADGLLTVADFGCFQNRFVLGDLYADCTENGMLALDDFGCFQVAFTVGCP